MRKYIHIPTGNIGVFVKEYIPTGRALTMMIRLDNGREYFAPKNEFMEYNLVNKNKTEWIVRDTNSSENKIKFQKLRNKELEKEIIEDFKLEIKVKTNKELGINLNSFKDFLPDTKQ